MKEQRNKRDIAWEIKLCCTNVEQGILSDTAVIVTTCIFHHFNKLLHCSLQLIVSIVF